MKKLLAVFAFLCLAVGSTSAKGFLKDLGNTANKKMDNPEGSYAKIDTK